MTVKEFLDRMNQLPEEVKALELGFFDFGYEDLEWLNDYLENEKWLNWHEGRDFSIC